MTSRGGVRVVATLLVALLTGGVLSAAVAAPRPRAEDPAGQPTGSFAFQWVLDGSAMTLSSCAPITWTLDETNVRQSGSTPELEVARWQALLSEVESVSAFRFHYVAMPPGAARPQTPHQWAFDIGPGSTRPQIALVIGYLPAKGGSDRALPALQGNLGVGGPLGVSWSGTGWRLDTSAVMLNVQALAGAAPAVRLEAMRHELGHALGLGHVDDPRQVMAPVSTGTRATWSGGDIEGLRVLSDQRCGSDDRIPASTAI